MPPVIVSHEHGFVFIKTRKTAGTSVELTLSRLCGPDDVITAVSPEDEELRGSLGGRGPQNADHTANGTKIRNHMPARAVRHMVGEDAWRRYVTFTIERNPWDVVVSAYHWRYREEAEPMSFEEFVATEVPTMRRNSQLYRVQGDVVVDKVCLFESLADDLAEVYERIGLPGPPELPHAKGGLRDSRHYRDMYGKRERDIVARRHADTIALCGYEF